MLRWGLRLDAGFKADWAAVTVEHEVYCFGRARDWKDYTDHMDVHVFNSVSLLWRKLPAVAPGSGRRPVAAPSSCNGHTAVLVGDTIYVWGGFIYSDSLYAFDVVTQTLFKPRFTGTAPEGRRGHSACASGKYMFIHGGESMRRINNDITKLDTATMNWSLIATRGPPPPASTGHSATIIGTNMFIFGGVQGHRECRVFDTETNHWLLNTPSTQPLPKLRSWHSAFAYNGELYVFSGYRGFPLNDLCKLNLETSSWTEVRPRGRCPFVMNAGCCCLVGDQVLFGGYEEDLYVLDLSPKLKTLCKLAVIRRKLDQSELPHDVRWELAAMGPKRKRKHKASRGLSLTSVS